MREVNKQEFYDKLKGIDCHPFPEGKFPYTSYFKTRQNTVVGKVVDCLNEEKDQPYITSKYYLSEAFYDK